MQGSLGDHVVHLNSSNCPFLPRHGLKAMTISTCGVHNVSYRATQAHCATHQFYDLSPSFLTPQEPHRSLYFCEVSEESCLLCELDCVRHVTNSQHKKLQLATKLFWIEKYAVLLQQDETKSKKKGKTKVFACTKCSLPASKDHPGEMLLSSTLSKPKYLHCHRMVPDGYRSGELEEVCILSCVFNIRCHYRSWRWSVRLLTLNVLKC